MTLDDINAIFILVISFLATASSISLAIWKIKPLQKGIILLFSTVITRALTPYIEKVTEAVERVMRVEEKVTEVENKVINYFDDQERALQAHKREIELRFEHTETKVTNVQGQEERDFLYIKEVLTEVKENVKEIRIQTRQGNE